MQRLPQALAFSLPPSCGLSQALELLCPPFLVCRGSGGDREVMQTGDMGQGGFPAHCVNCVAL